MEEATDAAGVDSCQASEHIAAITRVVSLHLPLPHTCQKHQSVASACRLERVLMSDQLDFRSMTFWGVEGDLRNVQASYRCHSRASVFYNQWEALNYWVYFHTLGYNQSISTDCITKHRLSGHNQTKRASHSRAQKCVRLAGGTDPPPLPNSTWTNGSVPFALRLSPCLSQIGWVDYGGFQGGTAPHSLLPSAPPSSSVFLPWPCCYHSSTPPLNECFCPFRPWCASHLFVPHRHRSFG